MATKNKRSYADEAKAIMNRYKLRLGEKFDKGDKLALQAMNQELEQLRQKQEVQREAELTPQEKAKSQFNILEQGLPKGEKGLSFSDIINQGGPRLTGSNDFNLFDPSTYSGMEDFGNYEADFSGGGAGPGGAAPFMLGKTKGVSGLDTSDKSGDTPFQSRVPWAGAVSQGIESILANRPIDFGDTDLEYNYENFSPTKISANLVDYSREREQFGRERDIANSMIRNRASRSGSGAEAMENIIAGATGTQRVTGQQTSGSLQNEGNINAQIRNQTSQFNAAQQAQAAGINAQQQQFGHNVERQNMMLGRENRLINQGRSDAQFSGVFDAIQGYGRDLMSADRYDQMINIMAPDNYKPTAGKDSWSRRFFQYSPEFRMKFFNTGDRINSR